MHDFDYDAMQKKRIARGAAHMKRGSKSKKCSLPHDGLTPAQLRRLSGPVSTYKLDEPMNWGSFKAMPGDLQKQYIARLQDTYQATDVMLAKMFDVTQHTVYKMRREFGIGTAENARAKGTAAEIREAKWRAFCNGVVGGKPSEVEHGVADSCKADPGDPIGTEHDFSNDPNYIDNPIQIRAIKDALDAACIDIPKPEKVDMTFVKELNTIADLESIIRTMVIPEGNCRIRISIEKV